MMMMKLPGILIVGALLLGTSEGRCAEFDFSRDVRPVLSKNCFACHGPDEKKRKGKLRLDTSEGALATSGRGMPC